MESEVLKVLEGEKSQVQKGNNDATNMRKKRREKGEKDPTLGIQRSFHDESE